MLKYGFFCVCFLLLGAYLWAQKSTVKKRQPRIIGRQLKRVGDTLSLDTIVIYYRSKRKDTIVIGGRYKGALPRFSSQLGSLRTDSVKTEKMNALIDSPLRIRDVKGETYKVVRYKFSYRKKDVYLDDETMSVKTQYELFSYYVYGSPMPEAHAKYIRGDVKEGEEFWFEEIMVSNAKGEQFLAPDIHIKTY